MDSRLRRNDEGSWSERRAPATICDNSRIARPAIAGKTAGFMKLSDDRTV